MHFSAHSDIRPTADTTPILTEIAASVVGLLRSLVLLLAMTTVMLFGVLLRENKTANVLVCCSRLPLLVEGL